ncbi:MAG TPA: phasin family protein [Sphingomicrobium sp.]|nr:phasin family protein [Sphingomicrobium sp.]
MTTETITTTKTDTAAPAVAVQKAAEAVTKTVADTVAKTVAKPAAKAAKPARRAKPVAKAVKAAKRVTRRAKPVRSTKTRGPKIAAAKTERNDFMTIDTNNWFASLGNFPKFDALPGADKFQSLLTDAGERSQEAVRRSTEVAEELADVAKANVEAFVTAGRIAATGAKSLGQDIVARGREGVEQASEAVKTLAEAKSPTEFFALQSEIARTSFDRLVSEGSRLTESLVKLTGEAMQPLSNRASANAERIKNAVA